MKTLKIEVPEGYEIDKEKSTFENIVFKEVDKKLPMSIEDLYIMSTIANVPVKYYDSITALGQLLVLRDAWNDGWEPDWGNGAKYKWCIYVSNDDIIIKDCFFSHQRILFFKTQELRDKFLIQFKDLIEIAKPLL